MPTYRAPVEESLFLINDVFHIDRYANLPGFTDLSPDIIEATLAEAAKLCEQVIAPLNRVGDMEGCTRHDDASVTTPTGFKEAFRQLTEGGWMGSRRPRNTAVRRYLTSSATSSTSSSPRRIWRSGCMWA